MAAESAGGFALVKLFGAKALLGMAGTSLLYIAAPPTKKDGSFDRHEFVVRLACAGTFSCLFGDAAFAALVDAYPRIAAAFGPRPVDLLVGAPAWWVTRIVALWLQRRGDKDVVQIIREDLPEVVKAVKETV